MSPLDRKIETERRKQMAEKEAKGKNPEDELSPAGKKQKEAMDNGESEVDANRVAAGKKTPEKSKETPEVPEQLKASLNKMSIEQIQQLLQSSDDKSRGKKVLDYLNNNVYNKTAMLLDENGTLVSNNEANRKKLGVEKFARTKDGKPKSSVMKESSVGDTQNNSEDVNTSSTPEASAADTKQKKQPEFDYKNPYSDIKKFSEKFGIPEKLGQELHKMDVEKVKQLISAVPNDDRKKKLMDYINGYHYKKMGLHMTEDGEIMSEATVKRIKSGKMYKKKEFKNLNRLISDWGDDDA
jgi:hypothetical protein